MHYLHNKPAYLALAVILLAGVAGFLTPSVLHSGHYGLPYSDSFAQGSAAEWTIYGGDWKVLQNTIRNDSNDRGAKLITGSEYLTNYEIDADVQLTNQYGDAGILFRVTQPELGANALYGYYATIRLPDQILLGKMDLGYRPIGRVLLTSPVTPNTWYHLHVEARGCALSFQASDMMHHSIGDISVQDADCYTRGSFGIRSFESGGIWRNIQVRPLP
jgi:Domain of Unknown Function (DUF1080)